MLRISPLCFCCHHEEKEEEEKEEDEGFFNLLITIHPPLFSLPMTTYNQRAPNHTLFIFVPIFL